jgi:maleate isomerase
MKSPAEIRLHPVRPALDARPLKKRVGLIILSTDHTTEPDFQRMVAGPEIGVYVARIPFANPVTPDNLRAMQPSLTEAAGLILPGEKLDAICYSCTSASVVTSSRASGYLSTTRSAMSICSSCTRA